MARGFLPDLRSQIPTLFNCIRDVVGSKWGIRALYVHYMCIICVMYELWPLCCTLTVWWLYASHVWSLVVVSWLCCARYLFLHAFITGLRFWAVIATPCVDSPWMSIHTYIHTYEADDILGQAAKYCRVIHPVKMPFDSSMNDYSIYNRIRMSVPPTYNDPVSMGTLNPRWCRLVVCSRLRPVSMGTLKPPWSSSVVWSSLCCPSKHP